MLNEDPAAASGPPVPLPPPEESVLRAGTEVDLAELETAAAARRGVASETAAEAATAEAASARRALELFRAPVVAQSAARSRGVLVKTVRNNAWRELATSLQDAGRGACTRRVGSVTHLRCVSRPIWTMESSNARPCGFFRTRSMVFA